MAGTWQTVRVFISSTFRDMHAERDWLVKRVFPALRERLQKYRIHLVDIDLRWGVTEQEAQKDQVLDLCLSQIDECRPFFVAILGERYGWVPETFTEEAASKYGWVQHHTGKSVTELEILYGVLRKHEMQPRAMFFFRDPAFIDNVPEAKQADLLAEDEASARKLAALKQTIRDAPLAFPPLDGYACQYAGLRINWQLASREIENQADREALRRVAEDGIVDPDEYEHLADHLRRLVHRFGVVHLTGLEEFGRRVSEQLWQAIKAEHELPDTPPAVTLAETDPLAEEAGYHEAFMESRLRVYVGRQELHDQLVALAEGDAARPCLVTGPSGSGKSAALARFARSYGQMHPDVLLIPHFVGASPGSSGLRRMLRRFCLELQQRFGPAEEVPQNVNELVSRFRRALEGVPADARVLLVIDALNQLDETDSAHSMYWLPWELPPQVKVVVSCIDEAPEGEAPAEPVLKALAPRPLDRLKIQPFTGDERLEIVSRVPSLSAKKLDPKQIGLLLSNPATENPLFLLVALEELRGFGLYEQVADRIAALPADCGDPIGELFGQVIERLREEFDPDVVRTALALLACSRSGMSQRELLEMIEGIGVADSTSDLFPVLRQLRPYLQHRGELLDFFHRGLYKAVRQWYLPDDGSAQPWPYHRDLAEYFHAKLNPPGEDAWTGRYPRALSELPHHQIQARLWQPLETTLTALPFLEAKAGVGRVFELAGDFSAAVAALPEDRPQRRILKLLDEALRRDIHFIARHVEDYPQALFQCLWNTCWWYDCPEAAAHYETAPLLPPQDGSGDGTADATSDRRSRALPVAPWAQPGPKLQQLLDSWRAARERSTPGFLWLRSHRPPPTHLGTAQQAVLRGHERGVISVAFSPNGEWIASASGDGTVRLWDAATAGELAVLRGHRSAVFGLAFYPDGRRIATGAGEAMYSSRDNTVRVWDAAQGAELAVFLGHERDLSCFALSPDGRRIVSWCRHKPGRVWDAATGDELAVLGGDESFVRKSVVWSAAFSPDGQRIASASLDKTVRLWDAATGAELAVLFGHEYQVQSVVFSPDGRRIASGAGGSSESDTPPAVRVWDATTGAELAVLRGHEDWVSSVSFSPDGRQIASGSWDKTVRVWDATSWRELAVLRGHDGSVASVSFSPDGQRIVSGSSDKTVRLWDPLARAERAVLRGHEDPIKCVASSPDGRRIASWSRGGMLRTWDAVTGAETAVVRGATAKEVTGVTFSPDGQRIALCYGKVVRVWDAATGAETAALCGHGNEVNSIAFSPDSRRIASGSGDAALAAHLRDIDSTEYLDGAGNLVRVEFDNTVRIWDAAAGAELATLRGHDDAVNCVVFSPDGRRVASASADHTVRVWDREAGAEALLLQGHEEAVLCVAFSPDGRWIASGAVDGGVQLWDASTGAESAALYEGSPVIGVAFSPDGRLIAVMEYDDSRPAREIVLVYEWTTGERIGDGAYSTDAAAIAAGAAYNLSALGLETVVELVSDSKRIAWFPAALGNISSHPSGRAWTGSRGNHLYIVTLDGAAPNAPSAGEAAAPAASSQPAEGKTGRTTERASDEPRKARRLRIRHAGYGELDIDCLWCGWGTHVDRGEPRPERCPNCGATR